MGLTDLLVGHGVVPPEESCCDEIGHNYVYGVVVMGQEDAEDPHRTQQPTGPVVPPEPLWRVCGIGEMKMNSSQ